MAQDAQSNDAYDRYTNDQSWSWSLDDNNNQPPGYFRWWNDGGNNANDLLMELNASNRRLSLFRSGFTSQETFCFVFDASAGNMSVIASNSNYYANFGLLNRADNKFGIEVVNGELDFPTDEVV